MKSLGVESILRICDEVADGFVRQPVSFTWRCEIRHTHEVMMAWAHGSHLHMSTTWPDRQKSLLSRLKSQSNVMSFLGFLNNMFMRLRVRGLSCLIMTQTITET